MEVNAELTGSESATGGSPKIKSLVNQSLGNAFIKADSVLEILGRIWRISKEDAQRFVESLLD